MMKKLSLFVLFFLIVCPGRSWAQAGIDQQSMLRKNEPIEIVADRMEAFQTKKMAVFSGNAEATQGDIKLKTDRLTIYYKDAGRKKEKIGNQDVGTSGEIDRIEAKGNVKITQKQMSATANEALYRQETAQIILTGNPVLQDGNNTIKGCRIVIFINENRGKVEQCDTGNTGRVTAIIQPKGKKN